MTTLRLLLLKNERIASKLLAIRLVFKDYHLFAYITKSKKIRSHSAFKGIAEQFMEFADIEKFK